METLVMSDGGQQRSFRRRVTSMSLLPEGSALKILCNRPIYRQSFIIDRASVTQHQ
jgi:hypothetical protein